MKPLVSILIPAHDAERWIAETIRSALEQSWTNKEIIIVDDGSTDATLTIAQRFASSEVIVVSQENQGAAAARNKAYSLCQGDYIQWLDADDLLAPNKIERQMAAVERVSSKRTLFSSSWGYFIYRTGKAKFIPTFLWEDLSPIEWLLRKWENNLHMQTATWLVSRDLTEVAGPWDRRLLNSDDAEYFCRVLHASNHVCFVADAKVFYRQTNSSSLSYVGRSKAKIEAHFLGMRLQIDRIRSLEDSDRVRAACMKHLQTCLAYFYPERPDLVLEIRQLAAHLGGKLEIPSFQWKYRWIEKLFGFAAAKHVQLHYNLAKSWALSVYDRIMYVLSSRPNGLAKRAVSTAPVFR